MLGHKKRLENKLIAEGGTVAWATVLEAQERWSSASGQGYYGPSKVTDHMHVRLRVEPETEPAWETELSQAFPGLAPATGCSCRVVYDPADRSRIAVIENSVHPAGITHEQAERSEARRAAMKTALENGTMAQYIEEEKAKALSSAGIVIGPTGVAGAGLPQSGALAPNAASPESSVVDQLTKLADLRDRGALTEAEFQAEKAKLLAGG